MKRKREERAAYGEGVRGEVKGAGGSRVEGVGRALGRGAGARGWRRKSERVRRR
jgi:hypothetical protein